MVACARRAVYLRARMLSSCWIIRLPSIDVKCTHTGTVLNSRTTLHVPVRECARARGVRPACMVATYLSPDRLRALRGQISTQSSLLRSSDTGGAWSNRQNGFQVPTEDSVRPRRPQLVARWVRAASARARARGRVLTHGVTHNGSCCAQRADQHAIFASVIVRHRESMAQPPERVPVAHRSLLCGHSGRVDV